MINFTLTVKFFIYFFIFSLRFNLLYAEKYDYSSNIYRDYLKKAYKNFNLDKKTSSYVINKICNFNDEYVLPPQKSVKCDYKRKKAYKTVKPDSLNLRDYPLLKLMEEYEKITLLEEKYEFTEKIKNPVIKDYFELNYYQRIDNQIEYIKKLTSVKKFDIFLTLPYLLDYLKTNNPKMYLKVLKDVYQKNKSNPGVLFFYESEFNEAGLNTSLIDDYFLYEISHIQNLIEKYKKLDYPESIGKIIPLLKLYPENKEVFLKVVTWNLFFKKRKDYVKLEKIFPFIKKNPVLNFRLMKSSLKNILKSPYALLKFNFYEADALYKLFFGEKKEENNEFFKKELQYLSQKELKHNNILKIEQKIKFKKDASYEIIKKTAVYYAKNDKTFYEIPYIDKEEKVDVKKIYLFTENGIERLNDYEILTPYEYEGLYTDMRILRYDFKVSKGDVLYVEYAVKSTKERDYFKNKVSFVEKIMPPWPVIKYCFEIIAPKSLKLKISYSKNIFSEEKIFKGKYLKVIFRAENLKAFKKEPFYRFDYKKSAYISISNFQNYKEVNDWFSGIIFDKNYRLSEKNKKYLKMSVERSKSDKPEEIVEFFYNYILDNIHYVGIELGLHSYKPYHPDTVLENKYGDCKDRALLFNKIMDLFGIKTEIVLVSTFDFGSYDFSIPSYAYFNHALVYLPDFKLFLDLTDKYVPFYSLPDFLKKSKIFILNTDNKVHELDFKEMSEIIKEKIYYPIIGGLNIKHTEIYKNNSEYYNLISDFKNKQKEKYETYLTEYYNYPIKIEKYKENLKKRENPKIFYFEYTLPFINNKISFIKLFQDKDSFEKMFIKPFLRRNDFYFNDKIKYKYKFVFKKIKNIYPADEKEFDNTYFKASLKIKNNSLTFSFKLKTDYIPAEELNSFRGKLKELDNFLSNKYYLEFK